ncbi:MAG TPA: class I SAM-dependent methyltransferase, partial [Patescibacteria group bacterium]|nr:class I SAM-dependent methyltransferase [Patescibacteria group bacterium]
MAERILFSYTRITVVSGRPERRREQQKPATKESSLRHRDGRGGVFDHSVALAYAESRHGVDGRLLDPILETFLKVYAPDATIADIGMGAGTVAIEAVKAGAKKVHGLDNSQAMLDQAAIAITQAEEQSAIAQDSISIVHGSAESLPYKND